MMRLMVLLWSNLSVCRGLVTPVPRQNTDKNLHWVAAKNGPLSFLQTAQTFNNSISLEDGDDKIRIMF